MFSFANVELRLFEEASFTCRTLGTHLTLNLDSVKLMFFRRSELLMEFTIGGDLSISRFSHLTAVIVKRGKKENLITSYVVTFSSLKDLTLFLNGNKHLSSSCTGSPAGELSSFEKRTDSWSAVQYFQFYSYLSQQQNMMQDYIRTSTYQRAILANAAGDFRGKVVLDVGAGSGILSFFAIQAGAKKVYAVEASNMAAHCNSLVQANKLAGRIVVISGKIEEISLPEPVDIIISEPMGYMLYNERMLETYVHARKFLAPQLRQSSNNKIRRRSVTETKDIALDGTDCISDGAVDRSSDLSSDQSDTEQPIDEDLDLIDDVGKGLPLLGLMFPTVANMYVVPFSDEALFAEQHAKANFWCQQNFHGMDLTGVRSAAMTEYFNQPIVDTFDIGLCPALPCMHKVDFRTVTETELTTIDIPLHFQITTCTTIHGLAFWFDVGFLGSQREVWLSTSPTEPLTHWYQVRCLFDTPLFVQEGQPLDGRVLMEANTRQSYDVHIELLIPGSQMKITNQLDLKNPHFRYNGYPPAPPPGSHSRSPTETFYANLCIQQQSQHLQVPSQSLAAITLPLGNVGNSALATGANSLFTLPTASANVGQVAGISVFPNEQGNILTTSDHIQSPLHLQQMHLSPQPINSTTSNPIALPTQQAHHPHPLGVVVSNTAAAQMIVDQCAVPSIPDLTQHSTAFFPRIATVVPVIDQAANLTTPVIGSANGWRASDFVIE